MAQEATMVARLITQADTRGLTRAEKEFKSFQRTLVSVGRSLGLTLSVGAIVAYGKASVKAATEDARAQKVLANQLANVGLSFESIRVERFISQMEKTTGILDDNLRPAFAQLIRVTGSVAKTQELLQVAFDAGAGSGVGFAKAVDILSQAYVGNFKGIKQLNLGLTATEMKTMTVTSLVDKMKQTFKGAGSESVTALDVLRVGLSNIQEQFGYGLTDGFAVAQDVQNLNDLADGFDGLYAAARLSGRVGGTVLRGISSAISTAMKFMTKEGLFKIFGGFGAPSAGQLAPIKKQSKEEAALEKKRAEYEALRKKREQEAAARLKAIEKQQKSALLAQQKQVALQKLSNLLRQAQKVFDQEAITLAAAAQGKLTEEERARLKLKQDIYDLEQSIAAGNVEQATKIAQTLISDAEILKQLREGMLSLNGLPDPFEVWLNTLREILLTLTKIPTIPTNPFNLGINAAGFATQNGVQIVPTTDANNRVSSIYNYPVGVNPYRIAAMADGGIVTKATPAIVGEAGAEAIIPLDRLGQMSSPVINIQINPAVAGLIDVIQQQSASGISPIVNRVSSPYIA